MFEPNLILETNRIFLSPLVAEDTGSFVRLTDDPSIWTYFTSDFKTGMGRYKSKKQVGLGCRRISK